MRGVHQNRGMFTCTHTHAHISSHHTHPLTGVLEHDVEALDRECRPAVLGRLCVVVDVRHNPDVVRRYRLTGLERKRLQQGMWGLSAPDLLICSSPCAGPHPLPHSHSLSHPCRLWDLLDVCDGGPCGSHWVVVLLHLSDCGLGILRSQRLQRVSVWGMKTCV